jgi:beta-glucosidase
MTESIKFSRRELLGSASASASAVALALAAAPAFAETPKKHGAAFPQGFLWGAASAGHQIEGNNVNSDIWLLEQVKPTFFRQPSGDACNSFERWSQDLDLVRALGLNAYRFSLEWARIEPAEGQFSIAMLDHYKAIIDGCHARGLTPMVTYNHMSAPRWFAALGGWEVAAAADRFTRYCECATKHLGDRIDYAITLNEPNLLRLLRWFGQSQEFSRAQDAMLAAAAKACGSAHFSTLSIGDPDRMLAASIAGHERAYAAIKAIRPQMQLGVSLAVVDDQAVGPNSRRDEKRRDAYETWLAAATRAADFIGVQNYERQRLDAKGPLPHPPGSVVTDAGAEYYPASLANSVRYVHETTRKPIIVTENGIATADDALRQRYIPEALSGLRQAIDEGVPVLGYMHWSLLDSYEWVFGYAPRYGLVAVDPKTFARTPKPSAGLYGALARRRGQP